jgi:hypothetical protein
MHAANQLGSVWLQQSAALGSSAAKDALFLFGAGAPFTLPGLCMSQLAGVIVPRLGVRHA